MKYESEKNFSKEIIINIFTDFLNEMIEKYISKQKIYQDNWFEIIHINEMINELKDSLLDHTHQWSLDNQYIDIANYCCFIHTLIKIKDMDESEFNYYLYQKNLKEKNIK